MIESEPLDFWPSVIAVFAAQYICYYVAQIKEDNSIVDTMWGPMFIIPNLIILVRKGNWNERTILTFTLLCVWGVRLAYHMASRHTGEEDGRF
jgi:steroid 5-alpha reductase family enzyme